MLLEDLLHLFTPNLPYPPSDRRVRKTAWAFCAASVSSEKTPASMLIHRIFHWCPSAGRKAEEGESAFSPLTPSQEGRKGFPFWPVVFIGYCLELDSSAMSPSSAGLLTVLASLPPQLQAPLHGPATCAVALGSMLRRGSSLI